MHKLYGPILLVAFYWSCVCCVPTYTEGTANVNNVAPVAHLQNTLLSEVEDDARNSDGDASNYDKRVERYAFGLGRRAYTYTNGGNGVKRLPVYNFGLGKRARPFNFGLGKRAEYDDDDQYDGDYERNLNNGAFIADDNKRSRPYSFGLGKRDVIEEGDRHGYPNRYGFGLGRR